MPDLDRSRLALSLLLSIIAGGFGYWRNILAPSGWPGAVLVGTATAGLGGWDWGLLVIVFFASSSALGRLGARRKAAIVAAQWEKGDRRDWGQVLANGGLGAALAGLYAVWPSPLLWNAYVGVLAAVTGDTWATEIGVLSRQTPRLITTSRPVPAGTSGGVTLLGTAAALGGTAAIGLAAIVLQSIFRASWQPTLLPIALVGGSVGVLCDSLLGATVQAIRWCPRCRVETERDEHSCGASAVPLRGWRWLRNDAVNALASLAGGLAALGVAAL